MKSGVTTVSASLLCILAAVHGGDVVPRLDVPRGFTASVYAQGIDGARNLDLRPDGTLVLQGRARGERVEIAPPTADQPVTVLRVAADLDAENATDPTALAVQSPHLVQMRWDATSGELGYDVTPAQGVGIPVAPRTLALARRLAHRPHADVAMAPDGSLFVADTRAGAVWRVRPTTL